MRLVFMGTPEIAIPSLNKIESSDHTIAAVFTQPDRPSGRGRTLKMPPVKIWALEKGLRIHQPESLKLEKEEEDLKNIVPDCIVAVAYGLILPKKILDIPSLGCINLHFSLLPKYRGAAPVNWALVKGEEVTGVTTFLMNEKMDEGDILLQQKISIDDGERADSLSRRLSEIGADLLIRTLDLHGRSMLKPIPQDHSSATYAPIIKKEDGKIEWNNEASVIACMIRGFYPWPGARSSLMGRNFKIVDAVEQRHIPLDISRNEPGTILSLHGGVITVACGKGSLLSIGMLQPEGRKEMKVQEAVNGRYLKVGDRFAN